MRRSLSMTFLAAAMIVGTATAPAGAGESSPAATVDAFYRWYVARHGRVEKSWSSVRRLFADHLYGLVDETYFKDGDEASDVLVRTCPAAVPECKSVRYDLFSNAQSAATSYTIGATRIDGARATVKVTLHLPNGEANSRVTAVLENDAGRYVISNLLFEARYYYGGPIVDLKKFLGDFNC